MHSSDERNKKRTRRSANEIERKFVCWCGKAYGSEGSLNQHRKLKKHFENAEQAAEGMEPYLVSRGVQSPEMSEPEKNIFMPVQESPDDYEQARDMYYRRYNN